MTQWNGEERRKNYIDMNEKIQKMEIETSAFVAKVTEWMNATVEYRKTLCQKIDKIDTQISNHITEVMNKLNLLPCRERQGWYASMAKQMKWMWAVCSAILVAILLEWVKGRV